MCASRGGRRRKAEKRRTQQPGSAAPPHANRTVAPGKQMVRVSFQLPEEAAHGAPMERQEVVPAA